MLSFPQFCMGFVISLFPRLWAIGAALSFVLFKFGEKLLCKIVTFPGAITKRWIFENFLGRYSVLLRDAVPHVRKVCTSILGPLTTMFGEKFAEQYAVPFLMALSEDPVWVVRESACEVFVAVANNCTIETKKQKLAPRFIQLLNDNSRWVTHIALKHLGSFIATFADSKRVELEIQEGRLIVANSDIIVGNGKEQVVNINETSYNSDFNKNEATMANEDNSQFSQLPPGVLFPGTDTEIEIESTSSNLLDFQDDGRVLNDLTCLLDAWALSDSISSLPSFNYNCAESICKNDASAISANCEVKEMMMDYTDNIGKCNEDGKVGDDDYDMQCPIEVEDKDLEELLEMEHDGNVRVYGQLEYWSANHFEIDLNSYGRDINFSSECSSNVKHQIANFIQRHSDLLFKSTENSANDFEIVDGELPEHGGQPVEEDEMRDVDMGSESEARGTNEDENEQGTSSSDLARDQIVVPQALLDSFVQMVTSSQNRDDEINRHCAHSFPAVVFTVGRSNWPYIMSAYKRLTTDAQWRVRQILASSIHEIAAIIGEENADVYLVPVFEKFVKDVEHVRFGVLRHVYDFFKFLTPAARLKLLSVLPSFLHSDTDGGRNWRIRLEYARQCIRLCDILGINEVNRYLSAIALTLANDRISDVRKEASKLLARLLSKFIREEWTEHCNDFTSTDVSPIPITDSFVNDIVKGFAGSVNWQRRQTFALFCEKSLEEKVLTYDQFSSLLLDDLLRLASDSVANVRIAFVRALSKTRGGNSFCTARDSLIVRRGLESLLSDRDADCRRAARISLGLPDTESEVDVKGYARRICENEQLASIKYEH